LTYHGTSPYASEALSSADKAGAPEIEITPAMMDAGVAALDEWLLDGELVRALRGDIVADIYRVMRANAEGFGQRVNVVRKNAQVGYITRVRSSSCTGFGSP
jgi:hypothetical protein